jgi:tRNA(Ile)-lysidine synthase
MLASSARRLQRARTALDTLTDAYCADGGGLVHTDRCGFFRIDWDKLRQVPEEIAVRVIGRCIAAAGGAGEPVPLGKLEPIVAKLWQGEARAPDSWTLARAQITAVGEVIQIEREPGRLALPVMTVAGGAKVLWDGRFAIEIADGLAGGLEVRALGGKGLAALKRLGRGVKGASALLLAPSFWRANDLLAVPAIDFWVQEGLDRLISADFMGLRYNSGGIGVVGKDDPEAS